MKRLALLLVLFAACARAPETPEERIVRLGSSLRCPVCRGVPISDSPAAIAQEMMDLLEDQVQAGRSDEEILAYFEERYGEWVLLEPKASGLTLFVWVVPFLVILGGAGFILLWIRRQKVGPPSEGGG